MEATIVCPKENQLSTDDLMRIVTCRAETCVTKGLTCEMKSFIEYIAYTYSEEAIASAYILLGGNYE